MSLYLGPEIREEIMFWWFMFLVNLLNPYIFRCIFFGVLDDLNIKYSEKIKNYKKYPSATYKYFPSFKK